MRELCCAVSQSLSVRKTLWWHEEVLRQTEIACRLSINGHTLLNIHCIFTHVANSCLRVRHIRHLTETKFTQVTSYIHSARYLLHWWVLLLICTENSTRCIVRVPKVLFSRWGIILYLRAWQLVNVSDAGSFYKCAWNKTPEGFIPCGHDSKANILTGPKTLAGLQG